MAIVSVLLGRPTSSVQTLLSCIVSVLLGTATVSNFEGVVLQGHKICTLVPRRHFVYIYHLESI